MEIWSFTVEYLNLVGIGQATKTKSAMVTHFKTKHLIFQYGLYVVLFVCKQ